MNFVTFQHTGILERCDIGVDKHTWDCFLIANYRWGIQSINVITFAIKRKYKRQYINDYWCNIILFCIKRLRRHYSIKRLYGDSLIAKREKEEMISSMRCRIFLPLSSNGKSLFFISKLHSTSLFFLST